MLQRPIEPADVQAVIDRYRDGVRTLARVLPDLLAAKARASHDASLATVLAAGVDEDLAAVAVGAEWAHLLLPCVEIAHQQQRDPVEVAKLFFEAAERLGLDRMLERIEGLPRTNRWDTMARSALRDDLLAVQSQLVAQITPHGTVDAWWAATPAVEQRSGMLADILDSEPDLARMSVGLRTVRSLMTNP